MERILWERNITRIKTYIHYVHSDAQKARARFKGVSCASFVIRARFDSLGNKIHRIVISEIEQKGQTMNFKGGACQKKSSKIGRRSDPVCAANMGFQLIMSVIFRSMVSVTNGFVQHWGRANIILATNKNKNYRSLHSLGRANNARPF